MEHFPEPPDDDPSFKEKIDSIAGFDTKRVSDFVRSHDSEEKGSFLFGIRSSSQLEEDLSQMWPFETTIKPERQKELLNEIYFNVLDSIGKNIPENIRNHFFPGLDLNNIKDYSFERARIKFFLLPKDLFEEFMRLEDPDAPIGHSGSNFSSTRYISNLYMGGAFIIDASEKAVVVMQEKEDPRLSEENFKYVATHELIHSMGIGVLLPPPLKEGITEWYSQSIVKRNLGPDSADYFYGPLSTPKATSSVAILMETLLDNGFSIDTIDNAFVSNDRGCLDDIKNFFTGRYGEENSEKIFDWHFKNDETAYNTIKEMELKQNFKLADFFRTTNKK